MITDVKGKNTRLLTVLSTVRIHGHFRDVVNSQPLAKDHAKPMKGRSFFSLVSHYGWSRLTASPYSNLIIMCTPHTTSSSHTIVSQIENGNEFMQDNTVVCKLLNQHKVMEETSVQRNHDKWQRCYKSDHQVMPPLQCDVDKQNKLLVLMLWCNVCCMYEQWI